MSRERELQRGAQRQAEALDWNWTGSQGGWSTGSNVEDGRGKKSELVGEGEERAVRPLVLGLYKCIVFLLLIFFTTYHCIRSIFHIISSSSISSIW